MSAGEEARHFRQRPGQRGDQGHAGPAGLPRQRRGTTPQRVGRYPDYDVLAQADHWDAVTRRVVLERVERVPPFRFFDERERETVEAFCDTITAQDAEPRIPVAAYVDEKLHEGSLDGYQYFDMPDDRVAWRLIVRGLDDEARALGAGSFGEAGLDTRVDICHRFSQAKLTGGVWSELNVGRAWSLALRNACEAFYAHPWAWNEIGFGGPAYPRGYSRFGSPHLDGAERESWEGKPALDVDPVRDAAERGLD
ncbi:MAG TPA: gluconate 2-dehydrogenase subunit 3 family protein [Gaiellaceae bacterium]|nr:gluconate 2-dehydrogenase subunit 3 family protein [Gaiellaceae bacterium]